MIAAERMPLERRSVLPLLLSLLAFAGGCGCRAARPEPPPKDVIPIARITPDRVPAGDPVSVRYQWKTGPAFGPPAGPYRAFVHFVDREGSLLFTDDHRPSPPVEEWQPDRTYAYTRIVLTREFPYAGEVTVLMGLYAASGAGERLSLRGDPAGGRRYRTARFTLAPRDRGLALRWEGLYEPEASAQAPLFLARFMKRTASCRFDNPGEDAALFLSADVATAGFREPPRLTVEGRARWSAELPLVLTDDAQLLRVRIPRAALGRRPESVLSFTMSDSYVPKRLGGSDDPRELSLRILGARILKTSRLEPVLLEGAAGMESRPGP